ncbi:MAG: hypothetical protein ACLVJO_03535 [[Clostridium] scindens]
MRKNRSHGSLAERKAFYTKQQILFGAIGGLAIFIMMFSTLSMINTLITNIVTKQELAVLSPSVWQRADQKMLLCESLILVLAAVGVTTTVGFLDMRFRACFVMAGPVT